MVTDKLRNYAHIPILSLSNVSMTLKRELGEKFEICDGSAILCKAIQSQLAEPYSELSILHATCMKKTFPVVSYLKGYVSSLTCTFR